MLEREVQRDRATERFAEIEHARRIHAGLLEHAAQRRARVAVGALLAGSAAAAAVPAIVEQQDVKSPGRRQNGVKDTVADVARVAMAKQELAERLVPSADPPAVQPLAVVGLKRDVAVVQSRPARRLYDRPEREVQQRARQRSDHRIRLFSVLPVT
ncbi:MAG TPA: hypothetical protein VEF89_23460 [Solirubrobacteraceae bacterium]|nr:hypothetical protein [Solirubrobacteraceae bacterium]